jgi:hypothetical protein
MSLPMKEFEPVTSALGGGHSIQEMWAATALPTPNMGSPILSDEVQTYLRPTKIWRSRKDSNLRPRDS